MGQKVNPIGFRLVVSHAWRSVWCALGKDYAQILKEDLLIRSFLGKKLQKTSVGEVLINREGTVMRIVIVAGRPGAIIGLKGQNLNELKMSLCNLLKKDVVLDVQGIKDPDGDPRLIAQGIALQLERRGSFRRAIKKSAQLAMVQKNVGGIRIQVAGRLGGAEIARTESIRERSVPLHTLRADVDYGFAVARTIYGAIGVKVWVYNKEKDQ